jgi:hypothetical protein
MKTNFEKTEATVPDMMMMMMMMSHCKRGVAKCLALSLTYTTCRQHILASNQHVGHSKL